MGEGWGKVVFLVGEGVRDVFVDLPVLVGICWWRVVGVRGRGEGEGGSGGQAWWGLVGGEGVGAGGRL